MTEFYCSIPEYLAIPRHKRARKFEDIVAQLRKPGGYWNVRQINKLTDAVEVEQTLINNFTDNGVSQMYDAILRASAPTQFTPANIMIISATLGFTTLTSGISSGGTVTSITVAAPTGANIPSGTNLIIDPGGHNFAVTLTQTINGAGTFTVTSVPGPGTSISSGASVRYAYSAVPTADPSTIASPVSYTAALTGGQFTKTITTGYGNRAIAITNASAFLFSTTGSPAATAGSYTEAWMSNANPITATNQTVLRVVFDTLLVISSTQLGSVQVVEKL